jgi:N-acyl-D-aspartate/D-glutamate deacylase
MSETSNQAVGHFDLIVRNGLVVDGTGLPRRRVDVGVRDGKVAWLGHLGDAKATEEIDAEGMIVAPGIVDVPFGQKRSPMVNSPSRTKMT